MKSLFLILLFSYALQAQQFTELGRITGNDKAFNQPEAVSVSVDGKIYVVDSGNNRIQLFDKRGQFLRTIGGFGFNDDQFDHPTDVWTRSLINIYVADYNNYRIQRYDRGLNFISSLKSDEADEVAFQFEEVKSCALNSNNDLFVLEHGENKIIKINRHGEIERSFGSYESGDGELREPQQLDILKNKFLIVSDAGQKAILVFDFFGNFIQRISHSDFKRPAGLCVLDDGSVILADEEAKQLFLISPDFSKLKTIPLNTGKPVSRIMDAAVWQTDKQTLLYLIDGDEVIIGYLR